MGPPEGDQSSIINILGHDQFRGECLQVYTEEAQYQGWLQVDRHATCGTGDAARGALSPDLLPALPLTHQHTFVSKYQDLPPGTALPYEQALGRGEQSHL